MSRAWSWARSTLKECLNRAEAAGVGWPVPADVDDAQLEARLYPAKPLAPDIALPDFAHVQRELARPGVTRLLLWQEYKAQHPDGLQYSAFCDQYRQFSRTAEPVMRFEHRTGEKCFVDYAGHTVGIIDRHTGEIRESQIFVAVLGCSNYTYAEATWTQSLPDWLGAHVRALIAAPAPNLATRASYPSCTRTCAGLTTSTKRKTTEPFMLIEPMIQQLHALRLRGMTAAGLAFIGAATDNYLRAFDIETGRELWKGRLRAARPHR